MKLLLRRLRRIFGIQRSNSQAEDYAYLLISKSEKVGAALKEFDTVYYDPMHDRVWLCLGANVFISDNGPDYRMHFDKPRSYWEKLGKL